MKYWDAYNSIYTKIIENKIGGNIIKIIILLIIFGIGLKLVINCLEFIFNIIKKILEHIKKTRAGINDDICYVDFLKYTLPPRSHQVQAASFLTIQGMLRR